MAVVRLNGKEVDLAKALPWTLGDWEDLESAHGINAMKLGSLGIKEMISLVFFVCHKANPDFTRDDARKMEGFKDPTFEAVLNVIGAEKVDPKSSTPSTPSGSNTAGASPT